MCGRVVCAQGKGIVIETEESKKIKRNEEDLNGVNPFYAILGAGGAAAMSFGSWKVCKCPRREETPDRFPRGFFFGGAHF